MSLSSTILGYPRVGRKRELKKAVEAYWAGRSDAAGLKEAEAELRKANLARLVELGLDRDGSALPENSSLYDQVLDITFLLGAVPERFRGLGGLDQYFALARGNAEVFPLEMTKWFDTNYHYLVPEIGPDTPISLKNTDLVDRFTEAKSWGYLTRPVIVGPVTYLALSKGETEGYDPLDRLEDVVAVYGADFSQRLRPPVQSGLRLMRPPLFPTTCLPPATGLSPRLSRSGHTFCRVPTARTFFSPHLTEILRRLSRHSFARAPKQLLLIWIAALSQHRRPSRHQQPLLRTLVAGVVDGRNIWATDLNKAKDLLEQAKHLGFTVKVGTSSSLQHVPHDTGLENWANPELNENLHDWLAFADQKIEEVVILDRGLTESWDAIADELSKNADILTRRAATAGVAVDAVRERVAALTEADRTRGDYAEREAAQEARLNLPPLPTTTIGSFPQTAEIRTSRAAHARGEIDDATYEDRMKEEIERVIRLQEELDIDVLVHGEAERNDMVQYFGELLDGFAVTKHGWVQSYGSRCTRPSILWGDVATSETSLCPGGHSPSR